jgi:hypothetical protein
MGPLGQKEHPLTTTQTTAACTIAALFWSAGVTLIDPRTGVGVLLCLIGIATTFWLFWTPLKAIPRTKARLWPWIGIVLLLIEAGFPAYMLYAKSEPSLDQAIQLACDWVEPPAPTSEKVHEIQLILGMGGVPTVQPFLDTLESPTYTYRCRFNNLSTVATANVTADMKLDFEETIKSDSGTKSGAIIASYVVDTPKITLGAGKFIDIYLRNRSPAFAILSLPTMATGQAAGSDKVQTFKLMPSQRTAFSMPPFDRPEPPKAAHVPPPVPKPIH